MFGRVVLVAALTLPSACSPDGKHAAPTPPSASATQAGVVATPSAPAAPSPEPEEAPLPDLPTETPTPPASTASARAKPALASAAPPSATSHANGLALRMLQTLEPTRENLVLAPITAVLALHMTLPGARGQTAAELRAQLGIEPKHGGALAADLRELSAAPGTGNSLAWSVGLYAKDGLRFVSAYRDLLHSTYQAALRSVPFATDAEAARTQINEDVATATAGRLKQLFAPGSISTDTRVVLTSAVALMAQWADAFDPKRTSQAAFTRRDRRVVQVPYMVREGEFAMGMLGDDASVIELPYAGGQLAMDIVLPGSLDDSALDVSDADALGRALERLEPAMVRLSLPRFTAELDSISLKPFLEAAGVRTLFSANADLSGISAAPGELRVTDIVHAAFIDVNEQGTEAAGATGVGIGTLSAGTPRVPEVTVNRPFLFVVRQPASGLILFAGRIGDPSL
jgi:serpin B